MPLSLGVTLERNPETNLLEIKQTGLIKRMIQTSDQSTWIGWWNCQKKYTPSESKPLVKNLHGEAAIRAFSYSRVVGHTRPDITFAVNCCAWYKFSPKHQYELLETLRSLSQTNFWPCGMVMNSSSDVCKIDAYPMLTLQGCMIMRITQIPLSANWPSGFIITFQSFLCFSNLSCYKQRQLNLRWKPRY